MSADCIIGIDMGMLGGIGALIHGVADAQPMPVLKGGGYDEDALVAIFEAWRTLNPQVFIEKVVPMPNVPGKKIFSSPRTVFAQGEGFGLIKGILVTMKIPRHYVGARTWQKEMLEGENRKDRKAIKAASCRVAVQMFPKLLHQLRGPRGGWKDGLAEGLLIAEYGRRKLAGMTNRESEKQGGLSKCLFSQDSETRRS